MHELLFATHNRNKAKEIAAMLGGSFIIKTLDDVGIDEDIPEDADTLEGNALAKARYCHAKTRHACFADDTGLEVEALGGAPGVRTARYAGPECNPDANIDKLLNALGGQANRRAAFRTIVAYIDEHGGEHLFVGRCDGQIADKRSGDKGFGYDPIFMPDDAAGLTFAQMPLDKKNLISHRGKAVAAFVNALKQHLL